jgi:hypothetical protein
MLLNLVPLEGTWLLHLAWCRNVSSGVEHFHQHFRTLTGLKPFSPAISREDKFAYKPSPEVG